MKKYLYLALIILISSFTIQAQQDTIINGRNTNLIIAKSVPWINLASQTYVLSPLGPDYGFCVSMINNNPTSSHTFTVAMSQTGDSDVSDFSHNIGRFASLTVVGTPSPIAASTTQTFFVRSNGAAKIAFQFTGGTTQAGSPDTVDIFAVQTTAAGCGTVNPQTGQSYTLATPNTGTSSAPPIMAVSDGLSQSFFAQSGAVVNPLINDDILHVNVNNGAKSFYFDHLTITSTAATTISIKTTNSLGIGCGGVGVGNQKILSNVTTTGFANKGCTGTPGLQSGIYTTLPLPANTIVTFDLKGFIGAANTLSGIDVQMSVALTGTIVAYMSWYEK